LIPQWFLQLTPRERRILLLGALVLTGFLGYVMVFAPMVKARAQLSQQVDAQQATLVWMQQAAQEIQQLRNQSRPSPTLPNSSSISLLSLIDKSTSQGTLGKANKRIEPKSEQEVQVEFEEISFMELLRWLETLYNQSQVQVSNISMERQARPETVKARVTLRLNSG
jgi:general secretion pathway protein M